MVVAWCRWNVTKVLLQPVKKSTIDSSQVRGSNFFCCVQYKQNISSYLDFVNSPHMLLNRSRPTVGPCQYKCQILYETGVTDPSNSFFLSFLFLFPSLWGKKPQLSHGHSRGPSQVAGYTLLIKFGGHVVTFNKAQVCGFGFIFGQSSHNNQDSLTSNERRT